jgi:hypothetical protein
MGAPPMPQNGLGIGGFVTGLIGLLFSFIPIVGVIAWPLVIIGLVLSILGFNRARSGKAGGKGLSIAGIVVSAVGLVISILYALVFGALFTAAAQVPANALPGLTAPATADGTHPFGSTAADDNGITFSVSQPQPYTPSDFAPGFNDGDTAMKVTVTITNNGTKPYDFNSLALSPAGTADGQPAPEITDFDAKVGDIVDSTILPGKSLTYDTAFSVPPGSTELQVEVTNDIFGTPFVFTGKL